MLTAKEALETAKKVNSETDSNLVRYAISMVEEEILNSAKAGETKIKIDFHWIFPEFRIDFWRKKTIFEEVQKYFEPYGYKVIFFDKYIKIDWSGD